MTKRYFVIASEREAIQVEILNRVQSIHSNKKYHQLDCFAHARNDETAKARSYQTLPPPQEDRFALLFFPSPRGGGVRGGVNSLIYPATKAE